MAEILYGFKNQDRDIPKLEIVNQERSVLDFLSGS
jgi:hypothetical protein